MPTRTRRPVRIWVLAALAGVLALGCLAHGLSREGERRAVLEEATARLGAGGRETGHGITPGGPSGVIHGELAERLRREPDPVWRRLMLARALVAGALDPRSDPVLAPGAGDGGALRPERLLLARRLSAEALARRPTAWQAPMFLGAATYLSRSLERDPRLFQAYREWEAPLELAVELAPGRIEPRRFLVVAYLELWPAVAETKRRIARDLMTEAFRDRSFFRRLLEPWLAVAEDREEAFAPIPEDSRAWKAVQDSLARQRDWAGFREARRRGREALAREQQRDLEEARARLAGGDAAGGRRALLMAVARGEPGRSSLPVLQRVLELLPPGSGGSRAPVLERWLAWSLNLCEIGRCPLTPTQLDRLAGLAGELGPARRARVALLSGRLPAAERLERRSDRLWHEEWSPYFLDKARHFLERGEPRTAAEALEATDRSWRHRPAYWLVAREVAQALGDEEAADAAQRELSTWAGPRWDPLDWRAEDGRDRLDLWLPEGAESLVVRPLRVPPEGAVVELRLNGATTAVLTATPGVPLELPGEIPPGLHRLEMETLAGGKLLPGTVATFEVAPPGEPGPASSA